MPRIRGLDPQNITQYGLDTDGLEEQLLFWIAAANNTAKYVAPAVTKVLLGIAVEAGRDLGPFEAVRHARRSLARRLQEAGVGKFNNKAAFMISAATSGLDLRTATEEELETIHGVGPKTSRCFVLHTRPGTKKAGLDTHILHFLRDAGYRRVPLSTPPAGPSYDRWQKVFLAEAEKAGKTPADFDLAVWRRYSNQRTGTPNTGRNRQPATTARRNQSSRVAAKSGPAKGPTLRKVSA